MRPQSFGQIGHGIEDLGWNDMGYGAAFGAQPNQPVETEDHVPSSIAALTPAPRHHEADKVENVAESGADAPSVVEQQRAIAASFSAEPAPVAPVRAAQPADVVAMPRRPRQAAGSKGKAAFTLRLDPERHLKLRLACAVRHRSAQQIVSEALDNYLASLPELEALTQQLPAKSAKRN